MAANKGETRDFCLIVLPANEVRVVQQGSKICHIKEVRLNAYTRLHSFGVSAENECYDGSLVGMKRID